jgi:hypothetical protein
MASAGNATDRQGISVAGRKQGCVGGGWQGHLSEGGEALFDSEVISCYSSRVSQYTNINSTMKKINTIIAILALAAFSAFSQTSTQVTSLLPPMPLTQASTVGSTNSFAPPSVPFQTQLRNLLTTGYGQLSSLSLKDGFNAGTILVYKSSDQYIVGEEVSTAATNGLNAGFLFGNVYQNGTRSWIDGTFNLSLTGTEPVPLIGTCQLVAETGVVTDLSSVGQGVWNETAAYAKKSFPVDGGNIILSVGFGVCYFQEWNATAKVGFFSVTDYLQGKHLFGLY